MLRAASIDGPSRCVGDVEPHAFSRPPFFETTTTHGRHVTRLNRVAQSTSGPRMMTAAVAVAALLIAGCVGGRHWNPFVEATAPVLPPEATCDQVVAHLNANIERCTSWRSTAVSVKSNGMPLSASAMMAVESPRRFRMLVSAMNLDLADLGSNDERMWFWMRPPANEPPYVLTCRHEEFAAAQQRLAELQGMPLPFRPDWLMDVLGVMPIDPATVELHQDPGDAGQLLLVSNDVAADGTPVRRVMTIDAKRGVIVGHTLWSVSDSGARLIAQAKLSDHRRDERSGVTLPHRIELLYPSAQAEMTLTIKRIEVNPPGLAANTWQPGAAKSYPWHDLASGRVVTLDQAGPF
jgi:outer membrane murein-binding lipoprotein Lpp